MPYIQNISRRACQTGGHKPGDILIQISDVGLAFPTPFHKFQMVGKFKFDDIMDESSPNAISVDDGLAIYEMLNFALSEGLNVIVHCTAGLCRSGGVVAAGIRMGFEDTGTIRQPNTLVTKRVLQPSGLVIDETTSAFANAVFTEGGILVPFNYEREGDI